MKAAVVPGQLVSEVNGVAVVFEPTVSVAQLVTILQKPVTWTQYWPEFVEVTFVIVSELVVAPASVEPSLVH